MYPPYGCAEGLRDIYTCFWPLEVSMYPPYGCAEGLRDIDTDLWPILIRSGLHSNRRGNPAPTPVFEREVLRQRVK